MQTRITGFIKYNTIKGDTFDKLAFSVYRNEKMAHHIIQANPDYSDVLIFDAGVSIRIPLLDIDTTPDALPPWRKS